MNPDISPFTPGRPVSADFFVGRREEFSSLSALATKASKQNRLTMGYVSGERGIGKSSLVAGVRNALESNENIVGAHVNLGGVKTVEEAVAITYESILKDNHNRQWWGKIKEFFRGIGEVRMNVVGGVEFSFPVAHRSVAVSGFCDGLRNLRKSLGDDCKGLFLVWDDINGLAANPDFANWLKSMVDSEAVNERRLRASIVLAGLEERRRELVQSNESVNRIFEIIDLRPWSHAESCDFFRDGFKKRNVYIGENNIRRLAEVCGGLPMLAHEVGDGVWRHIEEESIQSEELLQSDVFDGVQKASQIVGQKWLQNQVLDALKGGQYPSLLRSIAVAADITDLSFSRKEMGKNLSPDERPHFDNFLRRMKKIGAIVSVQNKAGIYRFPNVLYWFYFLQQSKQKNDSR